MDPLTCSPVVHWISKNTVASHRAGPSSKTLSDLRVRFHLNRFHPTFVSTLGACFRNRPSSSRSGRSESWPRTRRDDPKTQCLGQYPLWCTRLFFASINSPSNCWKFASSMSESTIVRFPIMQRYLAWFSTLLHVPAIFRRNRVRKDSPSFDLIKNVLADLAR